MRVGEMAARRMLVSGRAGRCAALSAGDRTGAGLELVGSPDRGSSTSTHTTAAAINAGAVTRVRRTSHPTIAPTPPTTRASRIRAR